MTSWARFRAGIASPQRAFLNLNLLRSRYDAAIAGLPRIEGPAIVLGSAPNPVRPAGVDDRWFTLTVNASQITAADLGLREPDLTIMRDGIFEPGEHQDAVWKALAGRHTAHLIAVQASSDDRGTAQGIAARNYHADHVTELSRHTRGAVIAEMSGLYHVKISSGVSNGIFAMLLALKLGGRPVVMAGFSFGPGWHFAQSTTGHRGHIKSDMATCRAVAARGLPVFAADPAFAEASGLPLWTGG